MSSYLIGRLIPNRVQHRSIATLQRHGYWVLLLSWAPVVGDALCVAAGWLRFNPWASIFVIGVGKFARYLVVAAGWACRRDARGASPEPGPPRGGGDLMEASVDDRISDRARGRFV